MPKYAVITVHVKILSGTNNTVEEEIKFFFIVNTSTGEIISRGYANKEEAEEDCKNENDKEENKIDNLKSQNPLPHHEDIYLNVENKDPEPYLESDFNFEDNTTEEIDEELKNEIKQKITNEINKKKNHNKNFSI